MPVGGRRHDYDVFKKSHLKLPAGVAPTSDLGYEGMKEDFPELNPHPDTGQEEEGTEAHGRREVIQQAASEGQDNRGAYLLKDEEVQGDGRRVQEQAEEPLRRDDRRYSIGLGEPEDNGRIGKER